MRIVCLIVSTALALQAGAVFTFEPTTYTAPVSIEGQDGWTNPVADEVAGRVLAYAGGSYAVNPEGGLQYLLTYGEEDDARAQHDVDFSGASTWTMTYDVLMSNPGDKQAMANAGNISLWSTPVDTDEDPGFMTIFGYMSTASDAQWGIVHYVADAGGVMQQDIAWAGLSQNNWYRVTTVFDVSTKQILSGSLYDLTGAAALPGWTPSANRYFAGGATSTFMPNAVRVYSDTDTGMPAFSNAVAWDNLTLDGRDAGAEGVPEPATFAMAGAALAALAWWRRR
jgi:hypothetical protein